MQNTRNICITVLQIYSKINRTQLKGATTFVMCLRYVFRFCKSVCHAKRKNALSMPIVERRWRDISLDILTKN